MKFKTAVAGPSPESGRRTGRVQKSDWLIKWLADQPRIVLLKCGQTADLNDPKQCQWRASNLLAVECDACKKFCDVQEVVSFADHLGMPPQKQPDEPPF